MKKSVEEKMREMESKPEIQKAIKKLVRLQDEFERKCRKSERIDYDAELWKFNKQLKEIEVLFEAEIRKAMSN